MRSLSQLLIPVLTAGTMVLASGHAQAIVFVPTTQTFNFSGNCLDCAQAAHAANSDASSTSYSVSATLVLQNYIMGSTFNLGNIVSFSYGGSNLFGSFNWLPGELSSLDVETYGSFSGDISALTNQVSLTTLTNLATGQYSYFQSGSVSNQFALGTISPPPPGDPKPNDDNGTGTWSTTAPVVTDPNQIPEPGSLLLVGGALAALGLARRRKP